MSQLFEAVPVVTGLKFAVTCAAFAGDTLYIVGDDGTLRCFKNNAAPTARPSFEADVTVPRFAKDKKACRSLHVVPSWNILISVTDSGVWVHSLSALSRPPAPLPHVAGVAGGAHVAVNQSSTLLAVSTRTRITVLSWNGSTSGVEQTSASAASWTVTLNRVVVGVGENGEESVARRGPSRERSVSFMFSSSSSSSSSSSVAGVTDGSSSACITRIGWVGNLLCAAVVHAVQVALAEEEDGVAVTDVTGGPSPPMDGSPAHDTGHTLTYLLLHPWTGQVMREVLAGRSPPLDVTGAFMLPVGVTEPQGLAQAGSSLLSALNNPAATVTPTAFGGAASSSSGTSKPSPPAPATWGAAALLEPANEEEEDGEGAGVGSALPGPVRTRESSGRLLVSAVRCGMSGLVSCVGVSLSAYGAPMTAQGQGKGEGVFHFECPPVELHRIGSLPYLLAAHSSGASVHNVGTGECVQSIRAPGVIGMLVCPSTAQHNASRVLPEEEGEGGEENTRGAEGDGQEEDGTVITETVFLVARTGIIALLAVPLVMQLAALMSRRPALLDTSIALCEHARAMVAQARIRVRGLPSLPSSSAAAAAQVAARERVIRTQHGYTLCAQGEYAEGLSQLFIAKEDVTAVLCLVPQIGVPMDSTGGGAWHVPSLDALPACASLVQDENLLSALPAFIAYLERQRVREWKGRDAQASSSSSSGEESAALTQTCTAPPASVVLDEALVGALLCDAHLCEQDAGQAGRDKDRAPARRARCIAILSSPTNAVRPHVVEALLSRHGRAAHLGCPELVSLFAGKGMVESAVRVLAAAAEAAVRTADGLGLPVCTGTWTDERSVHAVEPVLSHVLSLAAYLRRLGGRVHSALVLRTVERLLRGGGGRVGVLFGLWVLMPSTAGLGSGAGPADETGFVCLAPVDVLAMLSGIEVKADHGQWWSLRGTPTSSAMDAQGPGADGEGEADILALIRRLLVCEGERHETPPQVGAWTGHMAVPAPEKCGEDESITSHAEAVALDCRIMPSPAQGWARHFTIAYLEHAIAARAWVDRQAGGDRRAVKAALPPLPANAVDTLIRCYTSAIFEALEQLDAQPKQRVEHETGLLRDLRGRLQSLLLFCRGSGGKSDWTYDPSSALTCLCQGRGTQRPAPALYAERVQCLRALGRHDDALQMMLWEAKDFAGAEEYCAGVWAERAGNASSSSVLRDASEGSSAYSSLLRSYLSGVGSHDPGARTAAGTAQDKDVDRPNGSAPARAPLRSHGLDALTRGQRVGRASLAAIADTHPDSDDAGGRLVSVGRPMSLSALLLDRRLLPRASAAPSTKGGGRGGERDGDTVHRVLEILARNPSRVVPVDALALLPASTPLASVLPFIESSSRSATDTARSLIAARALASVSATRARASVVGRYKGSAAVEKTTLCSVCNRRLAAGGRCGPFIQLPDGSLTHVSCTDHRTGLGAVGSARGGADKPSTSGSGSVQVSSTGGSGNARSPAKTGRDTGAGRSKEPPADSSSSGQAALTW